ncbi:MoaD/ThiS family protein [Streptomyces sporangiiformans]|uniref:MoaD/ThiS family protein n=1 Tax=Streptomyces sporangiiformans TaxID=2315329 RepID=A0A505DNS0_9ACTN|nr:MoaD/ThiS family protein [Streptomyces sporangiiformans]TPQ22890.1 MoaD/ThiS family protein [Streptomyces sporangiiformans]
MTVKVQVPHGMAWCTGGRRVVDGEGATVGELWEGLADSHPELMWRLSGEAGEPGRWIRIALDGQKVPQENVKQAPLEGVTIVAITVMEAAPAAAPMGSKNPF